MKVGWSVTEDKVRGPEVSGGTWGQTSFMRLAAELRRAGEIRDNEQITVFVFDFARGLIQYKVEPRKVEPNLRS